MSENVIDWSAVEPASGGEYDHDIECALEALDKYLVEITRVTNAFNDGLGALPYPYEEFTQEQQLTINAVIVKLKWATEDVIRLKDALRNDRNPLRNNPEHKGSPDQWPKYVLDHIQRSTISLHSEVTVMLSSKEIFIEGLQS
jgi:hypothetical protein